jgi:hypothetical protein
MQKISIKKEQKILSPNSGKENRFLVGTLARFKPYKKEAQCLFMQITKKNNEWRKILQLNTQPSVKKNSLKQS